MIVNPDACCNIFWGDAQTCTVSPKTPEFGDYCHQLAEKFNLSHVIFLSQTHSAKGSFIKNALPKRVTLFEEEGDYIITNQPKIGLGSLAADCLPIVYHAPAHNVIAIAHAGWKGSVACIAQRVLEDLKREYDIAPTDVNIYFGPSSHSCCYEVQDDFLPHLEPFSFRDQLITIRDNKRYFEITLFNQQLLASLGVPESNISMEHHTCTICNPKYHSYRRSKQSTLRQTTMVWMDNASMVWLEKNS